MDRVDEFKAQAELRAKAQLLERKRHHLQQVIKTFEEDLNKLNYHLRCIVSITERAIEELCLYELIVDRSALKVIQDKKATTTRWEDYRKAISSISSKLQEGVWRWEVLRPFSFSITDRDGKKVIGWMIDESGIITDTSSS